MNKTQSNTESPNKGTSTPNNTAPAPTMTLAQCYKNAWATEFNKLSKQGQEILTRRLAAQPEIIRGEPVNDPQVNRFVKTVIALGEEFYAIQEKKAANLAKQASKTPA